MTSNWTPPKVRIVGPLKSRANQLAHARALAYEVEVRAKIMAELQAAADGGARLEALHRLLDELEGRGPSEVWST